MNVYITDGSADGFFTAVFCAYREKDCVITLDRGVQLSIDSVTVDIKADLNIADRVIRGIGKYDLYAVNEILLALRSCDRLKEQAAFNYIKMIMKIKAPVRKRLGLQEVMDFNDIVRKVSGETHNMKGFLRFKECANGVFYAPYSPDNDITDLLMPHFCERFKNEKFVIHDLKRKIAGIYNGKEWITTAIGEAEIYLSEDERAFEKLWKNYYKSVNIKERPHEKQMRGYMPARYWKFLPEKNGDN